MKSFIRIEAPEKPDPDGTNMIICFSSDELYDVMKFIACIFGGQWESWLVQMMFFDQVNPVRSEVVIRFRLPEDLAEDIRELLERWVRCKAIEYSKISMN